MSNIDDLLESIAEKGFRIVDKFLDKAEKKIDDEEFIERISKYINSNVTITINKNE